MARELLERVGIAIASAAVALLLSCALASPPAAGVAGVDQRTGAQQITVQAAPGSDVDVATVEGPDPETQPP